MGLKFIVWLPWLRKRRELWSIDAFAYIIQHKRSLEGTESGLSFHIPYRSVWLTNECPLHYQDLGLKHVTLQRLVVQNNASCCVLLFFSSHVQPLTPLQTWHSTTSCQQDDENKWRTNVTIVFRWAMWNERKKEPVNMCDVWKSSLCGRRHIHSSDAIL